MIRLEIGKNYYVQTLRYDYIGRLVEVGPNTLTLADAVIVFDTGPFDQFWAGIVQNFEHFGDTCQHWQGWAVWPYPIPSKE